MFALAGPVLPAAKLVIDDDEETVDKELEDGFVCNAGDDDEVEATGASSTRI